MQRPQRFAKRDTRVPLFLALGGALIVRLLAWKVLHGPRIIGDAHSYILWARHIAAGDLSGFRDYPLHQLYPTLLAPAFLVGIPIALYSLVLHLALSLGTVALIYHACLRFSTPAIAAASAAVAAVYPALLFWFVYVLTETPFVFFLAVFLAMVVRLICRKQQEPAGGSVVAFAVACVLLLLARPVSVAAFPVGAVVILYDSLQRGSSRRRAATITALAVACVLVVALAFFSVDSPMRRRVLRIPTVAQSLWLTTKLSSSSITEATRMSAEHRAIGERFKTNPAAGWDFRVQQATDYIRAHPARWLGAAARRFTSYWLPAFFQDGWSPEHRLFDGVVSIALLAGAAIAIATRRDLVHVAIGAIALSFALLSTFSQIDPDARYRVPAELALLLVAPEGYWIVLNVVRERVLRQASGADESDTA
jgi:hypothetical protein